MLSLARRIVDARVLHLIKMWLECPVEETEGHGVKGTRNLYATRGQALREDGYAPMLKMLEEITKENGTPERAP